MVEEQNIPETDDLEDLVYETRFLLNVLIDLLVEKKILTEDEVYKKYDTALEAAEKEVEEGEEK